MHVSLGNINITNVSGNSGVFVGSNLQLYWRSYAKENLGLGTTVGKGNALLFNQNVVYDNDLIDMPIRNK